MSIGTGFSGTDMMVHGGDSSPVVLPSTCITLSGTAIGAGAQVGDVVGTMSITCAYQGVPVWDMVDNANGRFAVNPSTGVVTVASALTAGDASIKVAARLIKPLIYSPTLAITISSGTTTPDWVPANAKIHIDLVGNRAWSNGAEVAINTLLGSDPNTGSAWGETAYDPADLTADGLVYHVGSPALVNAALSKVLAGATVVARMKQLSAIEQRHWAFLEVSADGSDALEVELLTSDAGSVGHALSWNGPFDTTTAPVVNHFNGAINVTAITVTDARFEAAVNGCDPVAGSHSLSNLVAVTIDVGAGQYTALQSITIYDPLPTTAGLSELSAI